MSCVELSYAKLMSKLQDLSIEDIGDPKVPLERQRRAGASLTALNVREKYRNTANNCPLNDQFHCWRKEGNRIAECRSRPVRNPRGTVNSQIE